MFRMSNFCGAYSLRSGVVTSLVIHACWTIFVVLVGVELLDTYNAIKLLPKPPEELLQLYEEIGCVLFATAAICVLSCFGLVIGVTKNHKCMVMFWLVCDLIQIILGLIGTLWGLVSNIWYCSVPMVMVLGKIFMWFVVLAFYLDLKLYGGANNVEISTVA